MSSTPTVLVTETIVAQFFSRIKDRENVAGTNRKLMSDYFC